MLTRAAIGALFAAGACAAAAGATTQASACGETGRIVAKGAAATVIQTTKRATYACTGDKTVELTTGDLERVFTGSAIAVRGTRVAYGYTNYEDPDDIGVTEIRIVDLADPKPEDAMRRLDAGPDTFVKVVAVRLARDGAVAWTSCFSSTIPPEKDNGPGKRCHRRGMQAWLYAASARSSDTANGTAEPKLLQHGRSLTPSSLRLSGRTVVWNNANKRRTAQLP